MDKLPDLQQLIDYNAENRLKQDLNKMAQTIQHMEVLRVNESDFPKISFAEKKQLPMWFFQSGDGTFYEALYKYWLPIYKNREAQNFIKKVEELQSNVQELLNVREEDY